MSLYDANGNPIGNMTEDDGNYTPGNMVVIVGLINKISNQPEMTYLLLVNFDSFLAYTQNQPLFTATVNKSTAAAYLSHTKGDNDFTTEKLQETLAEINTKYSITISEPMPYDTIIQDSLPADMIKNAPSQPENYEEGPTLDGTDNITTEEESKLLN